MKGSGGKSIFLLSAAITAILCLSCVGEVTVPEKVQVEWQEIQAPTNHEGPDVTALVSNGSGGIAAGQRIERTPPRIWISMNGGDTWSLHASGLNPSCGVSSLA